MLAEAETHFRIAEYSRKKSWKYCPIYFCSFHHGNGGTRRIHYSQLISLGNRLLPKRNLFYMSICSWTLAFLCKAKEVVEIFLTCIEYSQSPNYLNFSWLALSWITAIFTLLPADYQNNYLV